MTPSSVGATGGRVSAGSGRVVVGRTPGRTRRPARSCRTGRVNSVVVVLTRWVLRPLLELGYLVAGLFTGIVTFTLVVTSLALSIGLMPVFLLGIPVLTATI